MNYNDHNDHNEFTTSDIDLAASIEAEKRGYLTVRRDSTNTLGVFVCRLDNATQRIITEYASGTLVVNARHLLAARRRLFRAVRELR